MVILTRAGRKLADDDRSEIVNQKLVRVVKPRRVGMLGGTSRDTPDWVHHLNVARLLLPGPDPGQDAEEA